jgi:hypothetical protein
MYLSEYKYRLVRDQILYKSPSGFMEFDHVTNRYLYPDTYIKMIPYFLNITYSFTVYTYYRVRLV